MQKRNSILIFSLLGLLLLLVSCKPDLTGTITCPGQAGAGEDIRADIQVVIENIEDVTASDFFVDLVLSTDTNIPVQYAVYSENFTEDCLLKGGRTHVQTLSGGDSKDVTVTLSAKIPNDTPLGTYYLGFVADPGKKVAESDEGNNTGLCTIQVVDAWTAHVQKYRIQYGKSAAWETWMLANKSRYINAFEKSRDKPSQLDIAFRYDTTPIAYSPPWTSETEHMNALENMANLCYPGYNFNFIFNGDETASYANVIAGIPTNSSHASGKNVYLYYEAIFNHEFAHVMSILHHYDTNDEVGDGNHMPPGESGCLMDRNQSEFCSACRTALRLPLDVDNESAIGIAVSEINSRYPY